MTGTMMNALPDRRRLDLDWIRIAAFGLLILYHVGMLYVSWNFHAKSAHRITQLEPLMLALNPWRLALLFLVSGAASRFMLAKLAPGAFAGGRSIRLLLPLAFGMLVVVPPQPYLEVVEKYGYLGGFADFYRNHYLAFETFRSPAGQPTELILPTWNHLWFVAYLWVYTLIAACFALSPALLARAERALEGLLSGVRLLVVPALILAGCRLVLLPLFPSTHALVDDWYNHAVYGAVFAFGFLAARSPAIWADVVRLRWRALVVGVAAYAIILICRSLPPAEAARLVQRLLYGLDQWCLIVAILGFARRRLAANDGPVRRYLTDAVFTYYIVHQTAIIMLASWLKPAALPAWLEALAIVAGTAAICAACYELVRRIAWLRPLFGLKWQVEGQPHRKASQLATSPFETLGHRSRASPSRCPRSSG
jgi:acyltransferase-like protein